MRPASSHSHNSFRRVLGVAGLCYLLYCLCFFCGSSSRRAPTLEAPAAAGEEAPADFCRDLPSLLAGRWRVAAGTATAPPSLLAWESAPGGCQGAPSGALVPLAPLRGRKLALVGDSVTRYMMVDLATELFDCAWLGWDGAFCSPTAAPPASGASPACALLHAFACTGNKHADLLLTDGETTLSFVWVTTAEDLTHGSFRGVLGDPAVDGTAVSLGFWDVAIKTEGAAKSVAHHCAWMLSHVQAMLADALAGRPPGWPGLLPSRVIFWQPPFTEPLNKNHERIPRGDLEVVNGCTASALTPLGLALANTSDLLDLPPSIFEELLFWEAREPKLGALLTMEGYHPRREVRRVLLNALLLYFSQAWER